MIGDAWRIGPDPEVVGSEGRYIIRKYTNPIGAGRGACTCVVDHTDSDTSAILNMAAKLMALKRNVQLRFSSHSKRSRNGNSNCSRLNEVEAKGNIGLIVAGNDAASIS